MQAQHDRGRRAARSPARTVTAHALNSSAAAPWTTALRAKRPRAAARPGRRASLVQPGRGAAACAPAVRRACEVRPGRARLVARRAGSAIATRVRALQPPQRLRRRCRRSGRTSRRARRPSRSAGRHRSRAATGAYRSSSRGGRGQRGVAGDGGQHPRLDLAEVGADQHVARLGGAPPAAARPAGCAARRAAVIRPAAPSAAGHAPRSRPSGADVPVEPAVAVRRGDPLGLAPGQQRGDQRVGAAERLQPPRPGVGHVDPDRGRAARAPARGCAGRRAPRPPHPSRAGSRSTPRRPARPGRPPRRRVGRARADEAGRCSRSAARAVDRQPVVLQLDGQQRGGRLGVRGEDGQRQRPRTGPGIGQCTQAGVLGGADPQGERGPPGRAVEEDAGGGSGHRVGEPVLTGHVGPELAVVGEEVGGPGVGVGVGVGGVAEGVGEVGGGGGMGGGLGPVEQGHLPPGRRRLGQAGGGGPHRGRVVAPAAVQHPVAGGEVPAGADPDVRGEQVAGGRTGVPPDPPRPQLPVELGDQPGRVGATDRPAVAVDGEPDAQAGDHDESEATTGRGPHQLRQPGKLGGRPRLHADHPARGHRQSRRSGPGELRAATRVQSAPDSPRQPQSAPGRHGMLPSHASPRVKVLKRTGIHRRFSRNPDIELGRRPVDPANFPRSATGAEPATQRKSTSHHGSRKASGARPICPGVHRSSRDFPLPAHRVHPADASA